MKKKLFCLALLSLVAKSAHADTCATNLMPLFTAAQAAELCGAFSAGTIGVLANNTYAVARNAANGANINVWKVDTGDNTVINSSASDELRLQLEDDASRLIFFTAASDAAIAMKWGDSGTTATQILTVSASTSDADDDSSLVLAGGGAAGATRGSSITLAGEEVAGGGDITYNTGTGDTHIFQVAGTTELTIADDALTFSGAAAKIVPGATSLTFRNNADSASNISIADAGTITLGRAADLNFGVGLATIGFQEATAGTACSGTLTANGATPVVTSTTCATTGSRIFVTRTSAETTALNGYISAISNGVSFSFTSEAGDTGTYNWVIFHEAP